MSPSKLTLLLSTFAILLVQLHFSHAQLISGKLDAVRTILKQPSQEVSRGAVMKQMKPLIRLKHYKHGVPLELECARTLFMSPFHLPATFASNASMHERHDPTCTWAFIGTEPCIPLLSCETMDLLPPNANGECEEEYFEVRDGYRGKERFCGQTKPTLLSAADDLRDLFVIYKTHKNANPKGVQKFNCTVTCSSRGTGTPLKAVEKPKVNPLCTCGAKPKFNKIVNGVDATKGEFPWLIALVEAGTRQPFCGGSVINDRFILTAGHCMKGKYMDIRNIQILANAHVLDTTPNDNVLSGHSNSHKYSPEELERLDSGNGSIRFDLEEIMVHPLYVSETNDFDAAVLKLATPMNFEDEKLNPICLPELGSYLRTFADKQAFVAGWGLQDVDAKGTPTVLQKLEVTVFSPTKCKQLYAHRVNRRMLCAGYLNGTYDSCAGDSGGPLVLEDRTQVWYQVGAVSWGEGCAEAGNPGVYFRTTESGQWVNYHSNYHGAVWCKVPR